jgi:hypothetical protein
MPTVLEKPKKSTKESIVVVSEEETREEIAQGTTALVKKKSLLDYAKEFAERPVIRVLDEDLVYGSNMMTKLLQEEAL